jgi:hypothetical protein
MRRIRPVLIGIVLVFALYAVVVSPVQSASVVKAAFTEVGAGLSSVGRFISALQQG